MSFIPGFFIILARSGIGDSLAGAGLARAATGVAATVPSTGGTCGSDAPVPLLETTLALDEETEHLMEEYECLLSMRKRNNEEDNRYYELYRILADRIPPTSETKLERRANELALAVLKADYRPENILQTKTSLLKKVKEVGKSLRWDNLL